MAEGQPGKDDPGLLLQHLQFALEAALGDLGESARGEPPHRLLTRLLQLARQRVQDKDREIAACKGREAALLADLQRALEGKRPRGEDPDGVLEGIASLVRGREALEREVAELRAEVAELRGRLEEARKHSPGERAPEPEEDERLRLYREAFARLERDEDPTPQLEKIRDIERIFVLDRSTHEQTCRRLGHCLQAIAGNLGNLHRYLPIGHDPKRYKPRRLMGGGAYRTDRLPECLVACRDAAADCQAYMERAHGARGVAVMEAATDELRDMFMEMVRLVGDLRAKTAAATLSSQLNLHRTAGVAALPAALGKDLQELMRTKDGKDHAGELVEVLDEAVGVYRQVLDRAAGVPLPEPVKPRRNEKAVAAVSRLTKDLLSLAAVQATALRDAEERRWVGAEGERALYEDPHLLLRSLQDVDAACDVVAVLPGSPPSDFPAVPSGREFHLADLLEPCRTRCAFLEEVAKYRLQILD